ncbi:hypothetical protein RFI_22405 [Reticulomyxa filosa]|uniref:Viral A-type inclusion protein n=1 Tax=Reticulomyxa filosa TaxID=46433 RepID=X6MNG7_RETFI|nr:hypothetical protein RFI_22405 [Reticulomyxa filosa]|eukprot:ETO14962.1 hypothetical protein RFI_22405 [Reticulomyxa filosa]
MLFLNMEEEDEKETFSTFGCYNKDWLLLTNKSQKLNTLICCICKQIANNAIELRCKEHENTEQAYLVGEECLQIYLKQNNEKCPIKQHKNCEFTKNKSIRQQISDLLVICPRQYDLKRRKSNQEIKIGEQENETDYYSKNQCDYKCKIKDIKDHLDKSCKLISFQQIMLLFKELQSQLHIKKLQIEELTEKNLESKKEIEKLKKNDNEKNKQIQQLNNEIIKKDEQIIELINNVKNLKLEMDQTIIYFKKQIEQNQNCTIKLEEIVKNNNNEQLKQIEQFNVSINKLKLENEKMISEREEILKINNDNLILKKQMDNIITEFEQLKKEINNNNNNNNNDEY